MSSVNVASVLRELRALQVRTQGAVMSEHDGSLARIDAAIAAHDELVEAAKEGKQFIEYLLTHAPELPDQNDTVRRLRTALARASGGAP